MAAVVRNRFYPVIALALALITFIGFSKTYYLRLLFEVRPITVLVHLHSIVFTAWVLLFIAQTRLIAAHSYDLHRKVGIGGAVLATLVFIIGVLTAVAGAGGDRIRPMGFNGREFLIFPLVAISMFAISVGAALVLRKRRDLHKRFMLLAMVLVLGPAVTRILRMLGIEDWFLPVNIMVACAFLACAVVNDWVKHRVLHPVYLWGGAVVVLSWPLRAWIAATDRWESIAIPISQAGSRLFS